MKKLLFTPALLFVCALAFATVNPIQKQALVDLYVATDGENWVRTWDINQPVDSWHGVTVKDGDVVGLSLLFNKLNGTIPASIGNLTKLEKLELSFNQLQGVLPAEIGNMTSLKIIAFNGNNLSGTIPQSFGNLSQLKELHASSNKLTGTLPQSIGNLKKIEVLNVFDNDLTGALPVELAFNRNLKQLIIAENNIEQSEAFAGVLLFNKEAELEFKKPVITPSARTIIAIETSDDEN